MKRKKLGRVMALLLGCVLALNPCGAGIGPIFGIVSHAETRTASINATSLNVRSGPGTGNQAIAKLSQGTAVTVIGETTGSDGKLWYQIRFSGSNGETTGYVLGQYVKFPTTITSSAEFEQYLVRQGFPESYKQGLRELHAKYPSWTFTALHTNLDWSTAVENECVIGRNLVARDNISSWKSTAAGAYDWDTGTWPGFDGNSWVQASEEIICYYMDPRNFLNEKYIYQFMKQSYDSSIHTREGLESMVAGTFLSGTPSSGGSSSGGSSSGSGSGPASGPGASSGGSSSSGPISPVASISDHETERVTTVYGPGMNGSSSSETSAATVIVAPGSSAPGSAATGDGSAPGDSSGGTVSANPGSSTSGSTSGSNTSASTYVDIIMKAAERSGVNPYILSSMILQEQGSQGTGRSISGTVSGYQGYYNFFNIEAYQSGSMGAVERGLWWASQSGSYERPWNSVERSIVGGAIYYGNNYVKQGQDTLYLKKFNVQGSNLYKHQYMTNVLAAAAEGMTLAKISALKTAALEFSIPVYKNMPETACVKPTLDGSPNNKLSGLGVEGFALTPTFHRDTESYDLIVDPSVASVKVVAAAIDSKATVSGTGTVDLQSGVNEVTVSVKAENGYVRNYVLHVVRQSNGPVYSDAIGSNVLNSSSGSGSGSASGPGSGPGGTSGSSSSGSSSGSSSSNVVIIGPTDTTSSSGGPSGSGSSGSSSSGSGSGNSTGPVAPGSVNGFGTESAGAGLVGTVKGDVNGDGKLNIVDVLNTQRHILGLGTLSGTEASAADVNGNGKIDILDVLMMQKDILGIQKLN